uniref:4-hydroxy-tetrahydrodipicolinate reductase n=1 Tax=Thermodesulfobium narugense TaxID=184064 RepID=A0A7C5PA40_9BACT
MIRVVVAGIGGKMGRMVSETILKQPDMKLVGGVDPAVSGKSLADLFRIDDSTTVSATIEDLLVNSQFDVLVDFTRGNIAPHTIEKTLEYRRNVVVGTTGIDGKELDRLGKMANDLKVGFFLAPNFSLGAVLMMEFAKKAAKYYNHAEIIELHHNQKADAPSGTALRTAYLMSEDSKVFNKDTVKGEEKIKCALGGEVNGIRIHSVRLPGFVAHQEVLLGGLGEILTIRHDSLSRESFMPGVLLAIRKVQGLSGFVVGLENLL